jgi:hypothetical protein
MDLLKSGATYVGAEDSTDIYASKEALQSQLEYFQGELDTRSEMNEQRADLLLKIARVQVELENKQEGWIHAKEAFGIYADAELWESAVEACEVLFASDHALSLVALGHGIWLGITYPIDPQLSVNMLECLLDESPKEAETRAVAAAAAHFIAGLRETKKNKDLSFYTSHLLGKVADDHSHVTDQAAFDLWMKALDLNNPDSFLPKLSGVVDQLVDNQWWIDRDALRAKLPQ